MERLLRTIRAISKYIADRIALEQHVKTNKVSESQNR